MKLVGDNRKIVQNVISELYSELLSINWGWKKGEKQRIASTFVVICDELKFTEEDQFDKALNIFKLYVIKCVKEWVKWDKASRENYVGYICSLNRTKLFSQNYLSKRTQASKTGIAGTQTNDKWDF